MVLNTLDQQFLKFALGPRGPFRGLQGQTIFIMILKCYLPFSTFILSQVYSGIFQKLQNMKLLEKLHSLHSDCCIRCTRLKEEANMRIISSVKPEVRKISEYAKQYTPLVIHPSLHPIPHNH